MRERITGYTELIALLAYPIRHSSSPRMHNEAFAKLKLDYAYLAFEVGNNTLEDTIKGLRAMGVRGFNVSMPNKTVVCKYLDKLTPAAKLCQAVNTVVNENGILTGHITDGVGYVAALSDIGIDIENMDLTVVGGGGAATTIMVQSALDGAKSISMFNIKDQFYNILKMKALEVQALTNCRIDVHNLADLDKLKEKMHSSDIFTNATGIGMEPHIGSTYIPDISYFKRDLMVVDVVYAPLETKMLKMAKKAGCQTMNGLGMMLFQGAKAFELWTRHKMPIEYIKKAMNIK